MKCEICHKAEATTVITCTKDGTSRELYVCKACAERDRNKKKRTSETSSPSVRVVNMNDAPPPFMEDFVKAAIGFMKEFAENTENEKKICPACKSKWETIKETGRINCPACWKTFAINIRSEFLGAHYGLAHLGNAPAIEKVGSGKDKRSVIERDLKNAIAREDYRLAAKLKTQLNQLDNGENA